MATSLQGDDRSDDWRVVRRERYADDERPSFAVARAVAAARGEDVRDAGFALYDHVDTDAIDELAASAGDWELTVTVAGHRVTIDGDGRIVVRAR